MRLYLTFIIILLLLVVAFIFGSQNDQTLTLNYLIARTEITVAGAVSLFTLIGFVLGILFSFLWKIVKRIKSKRSNQPLLK